jgi:putative FmdB family regulatory protein
MPTFDYICSACQHSFEFQRPFGKKTHPKCPKCKSSKTEKQLTVPAISFKGSGFYKTDSSPAKAKPVAKKENVVKKDTKVEKKTEKVKKSNKNDQSK